jgi:hypothetical protein
VTRADRELERRFLDAVTAASRPSRTAARRVVQKRGVVSSLFVAIVRRRAAFARDVERRLGRIERKLAGLAGLKRWERT